LAPVMGFRKREKGLMYVTVPASEFTAFERALINVRTRWRHQWHSVDAVPLPQLHVVDAVPWHGIDDTFPRPEVNDLRGIPFWYSHEGFECQLPARMKFPNEIHLPEFHLR